MTIARSPPEPRCTTRRESAFMDHTQGVKRTSMLSRLEQRLACGLDILLVPADQRDVKVQAADSYRHTAILTVAVKDVDHFSLIASDHHADPFGFQPIR